MDTISLLTVIYISSDPKIKAILTFICISQETVFSVVDEDFSNCLVGVDSLLE